MITTATKELFRLWMVQKRRAFTWKDVFIGAYFFGLFVFVLLGVKHALDETGGIGEIPFPLISLVPLLAVSIIPGDMMMKLFWLFLVYVLAGVAFVVIGLAADDPSEPVVPMATEWSTLVASLLLILLNSLVCFILHRYFSRMKNHNEETHAPVTTTVRSLGQVSLWSIEWVQLLRSKRLRVSFFFIVVIFLLGKWAFAALDDYKAQKAQGLDPVFVAENFPGMPATECWHETREELPTIDEGIIFGGGEE